MFTELFPAILSLSFDCTDKQSRQIMSELAPDLNDYAQMFESLSNLFRCCLMNLKNYAYVTMTDNNAIYISMLISSSHNLWTLNQDPCLVNQLHFINSRISADHKSYCTLFWGLMCRYPGEGKQGHWIPTYAQPIFMLTLESRCIQGMG